MTTDTVLKKSPKIKSQTVLVAEDNIDFQQLLRFESPKMPEFLIHIVDSGENALKLCQNFLFDFVVLDIHLPGKSGIEVARQLRTAQPKTSILAFSSSGKSIIKNQSDESLFDGFLSKPFRSEEFLNLTANLRPCEY